MYEREESIESNQYDDDDDDDGVHNHHKQDAIVVSFEERSVKRQDASRRLSTPIQLRRHT